MAHEGEVISNCDKGNKNEREDIEFYKAQGWRLLQRALRSRHPSAEKGFPIDLAGAWDFWMAKDRQWLFVQVGEHSHRSDKFRQAHEWVEQNKLAIIHAGGMPPCPIYFYVDIYHDAHWEGRGKNKKFVGKTWRREAL